MPDQRERGGYASPPVNYTALGELIGEVLGLLLKGTTYVSLTLACWRYLGIW